MRLHKTGWQFPQLICRHLKYDLPAAIRFISSIHAYNDSFSMISKHKHKQYEAQTKAKAFCALITI
jgi:hypothetical protein